MASSEREFGSCRQTGSKRSGSSARTSESFAAPAASHPLLTLQQKAGNQAVQELLHQAGIHPKLAISQPDDPEERQADQVADRIMRMHSGAPISSPCSCSEGEEMCEECKAKKGEAVARKAEGSAIARGPHLAAAAIQRSSGRALDGATRAFFEPRFGRDFSGVRVHTDAAGAESARSISAHAYTLGSDIVFATGRYEPGTGKGRQLLAHELAHTIQQTSSAAGGSTAQGRLQRQAGPAGGTGTTPQTVPSGNGAANKASPEMSAQLEPTDPGPPTRRPANDVQPITGTTAKAAARLCNFDTGKAVLLESHEIWLDANVRPVFKEMLGPWVDIFGYASRLGDERGYDNTGLSENRRDAVKKKISGYANNINFQILRGKGSSESGGDIRNDDGYWRAAEFYVYATKPPDKPVEPKPDRPFQDFDIRVLRGLSTTVIGYKAIAIVRDEYDFEITDVATGQSAVYKYAGAGVSLSVPKVSLPASVTVMPGPPSRFKARAIKIGDPAIGLSDFGGDAELYQDPGGGVGSVSVGETLRLNLKTNKAYLLPAMVPIASGKGAELSPGASASKGSLTLFNPPSPPK